MGRGRHGYYFLSFINSKLGLQYRLHLSITENFKFSLRMKACVESGLHEYSTQYNTCIVLLARLNTNLAPLGARFIPYKTLVYLNVWEIKVE